MNARHATYATTYGSVETERVDPGDWRAACLRCVERDERFGGLFSMPRATGAIELRAIFIAPRTDRVVACEIADLEIDTLVDVLPEVAWHEREAHDLDDLRFAGHDPLRPLLDHDTPLADWTVPTRGLDLHQVAVGPTHAGVIESGHFRFHAVGDRVIHLDLQLAYNRRGLERAATGRSLAEGFAYARRACAACSVANSVAYSHACESALGLEPDTEMRRGRTLLLELERVYNHLNDISAICAGVGFAPGTMAYAALKERAHRLNESLTGHRFLFDTITVGASPLALDAASARAARLELSAIAEEHETAWRQLQFVVSLQERLEGVGILSRDDAVRLGARGPVARSSGVRLDVRLESPRLWYDDFQLVQPRLLTGDVASRMAMRATELEQSFDLLHDLLADPPGAGTARTAGEPAKLGVGRVESPRGETVCLIERDGDVLRAFHLRTGSYANWPVLAHVVPGNPLPDFPLINKSFELCYACADR